MMKFCLTLLFSLFSISAHADWYELGAAYLCEKNPQRLTIAATANSSNDYLIIHEEEGFTPFEVGETTVRCHVGTKKIMAKVKVIPPAERGRCGGIGNVSVQILPRKKDGYPIFNDIIFGNFCYGNGRQNIKVVIEKKAGNEFITTCTASDSEDGHFKDVSCETEPITR